MSNKYLSDTKKSSLKRSILSMLYAEGASSIPALAQHTTLSIPSLTEIIQELTARKWIRATGTGSTAGAGRRPRLYSLNPASYYILVFEIDLYFTRIALMNLEHTIVAETRKEMILKNDPKMIDYLVEEANKLTEAKKIKHQSLIGIGISLPGLVNTYEGVPYSYMHFSDNPVIKKIADAFHVPVFIDNDLKTAAYGEHFFGKARGIRNAFILSIDVGIGVGLILDGEVFHGKSGFSGELGHIPVKPDGIQCYCGKRGCLETVASIPAIIGRVKQEINAGHDHLKKMIRDKSGTLYIDDIIQSAKAGDETVIDILSETGSELGRGLANAIHILNPELIVIGGSIAKAGQFISNPVEQSLNKYCMGRIREDVRIELSELGADLKILGTHVMVMQRLLNENRIKF